MALDLGWALLGKQEGFRDDYGVLEVSSARSKEEAFRLAWRLVPGTPPRQDVAAVDRTKRTEERLPWLSGGALTDSRGRLTMGSLIIEEGARRDREGRLANDLRYFETDYEALAATRAGFTTFFDAVERVKLPPTHEVLIAPAPMDVAKLLADPARERWAMTAAALLLDKAVSIDGRNKAIPGPARDRLMALDAIAALLPYGFRADLVVSTWVTEQRPRGPRLMFGPVGDHATNIDWDADISSIPMSDTARRYLNRLDNLIRKRTLSWVLQRLADFTERQSFAKPEGALAVLSKLDRPLVIAEDIRAGRGNVRDTLDVLNESSPSSLGAEKATLLGFAVTDAPDKDLRLLTRYWSDELKTMLVTEALRQSSTSQRPSALLDVASAAGREEQFLLELFERLRHESSSATAGRHRDLIVNLARRLTPEPRAWPTLRLEFIDQPKVCCKLLNSLDRPGPKATRAWLDWLVDGAVERAKPWLQGLFFAAQPGAEFTDQHADELKRVAPDGVPAAVRVAVQCGVLGQVLDQLWPHLIAEASAKNGEDKFLLGASIASADGLSPIQRPGADLVLTSFGRRLSPVPSDLRGDDWRSYVFGAGQYLARTPHKEWALSRFITQLLTDGRRGGRDDYRCVELAVHVASRVDDATSQSALRLIATTCSKQAGTLLTAISTESQEKLLPHSRELRAVRARSVLGRDAAADSESSVLAADWVAMRTEGKSAGEVLTVLREHWARQHDVASVIRLLDSVREHASRKFGPDEGSRTYVEAARGVLDGDLSRTVVPEYRKYVERRISEAEALKKAMKPEADGDEPSRKWIFMVGLLLVLVAAVAAGGYILSGASQPHPQTSPIAPAEEPGRKRPPKPVISTPPGPQRSTGGTVTSTPPHRPY